jgi:hypothetical protein
MQALRAKKASSGDGALAPAKTIYVFCCVESGLFAFTADPEGHVLPSRMYPRLSWRFKRCMALQLNRSAPQRRIATATLKAIAERGFHLAHAAVNAELLALIEQRDDEAVDPCGCHGRPLPLCHRGCPVAAGPNETA